MFKLTKRILAAATVVLAAIAPSVASAAVDLNSAPSFTSGPPISSQQHRLDQLQGKVQHLFASEGGWPTAASSFQPAGHSAQEGFQWADAGIGAAGTAMLLGAGVAASGAARRRRTHRAAIG